MKTRQTPLAKGQIWKTAAAHIEIVALGKRSIQYKITKHLGIKRISAQISGIEAMENYLRVHKAQLLNGFSNN